MGDTGLLFKVKSFVEKHFFNSAIFFIYPYFINHLPQY
jgi:hypothetical protein